MVSLSSLPPSLVVSIHGLLSGTDSGQLSYIKISIYHIWTSPFDSQLDVWTYIYFSDYRNVSHTYMNLLTEVFGTSI